MQKPDFIEETSPAVSQTPFIEREHANGEAVFNFSLSGATVSSKGETSRWSDQASERVNFTQNYRYWTKTSMLDATDNTDNSYYREIVNMGVDAVPFILEELEKGPSQLVYALDDIFPGVMTYDGYVSLEDACKQWISILKATGKF